jgi:hypothetical protein
LANLFPTLQVQPPELSINGLIGVPKRGEPLPLAARRAQQHISNN